MRRGVWLKVRLDKRDRSLVRLSVDAGDAGLLLRERTGSVGVGKPVLERPASFSIYRVVAEYANGSREEKRVSYGDASAGVRPEGLLRLWWEPLGAHGVPANQSFSSDSASAARGWPWCVEVAHSEEGRSGPGGAPPSKAYKPPSSHPAKQTASHKPLQPEEEVTAGEIVRQLTPRFNELLELSQSIWMKVSAPADGAPSLGAEHQRRIEQLETENRLLTQSGRPEDQREIQALRLQLSDREARVHAAPQLDVPAGSIGRIIDALGAADAEAPGDRLTDEESRGLGQCLPYLQEVPEGPAATELNELAKTLSQAADHPLQRARAALDNSDLASALEHLADHVSNQAVGVEAKGRRYYVDRMKVIAVQLWREHPDNSQIRLWLPRTLAMLGLEMVVPEVGRSFSWKNQIAVDRRPGNDAQPRNSILEVVEPGFRDTASGKFVSKPKVVIASR